VGKFMGVFIVFRYSGNGTDPDIFVFIFLNLPDNIAYQGIIDMAIAVIKNMERGAIVNIKPIPSPQPYKVIRILINIVDATVRKAVFII
jgi:hypothetical protein